MPDDDVRAFVAGVATAQLVTVADDGTPRRDVAAGAVARATGWSATSPAPTRTGGRIVDGSPGLAVVTGPDAYVSPAFYATKREHGRVVPTWNYSAVHLRGPVRVIDDVDWLRDVVGALTEHHESDRERAVGGEDAPEKYVAGQLRAIVGVEMSVESVEARPSSARTGPRRTSPG